jgi:ABC-type glycerol-3-phosphate transport system substrate-binding protein
MRKNRILALFLVAGMLFSAVGCSGDKKATDAGNSSTIVDKNSPYASFDLGKPVNLKLYALGDVPADMQKIQDEANSKYFKPLLNTNVEINFLSWSDYQTKYDLVLAGGDQCDLIYTSSWCYYNQEAAKGAFKELKMDFINKYMPQTAKSQAPESWDQISIGGKIYAVPRNNAGISNYKYVAFREDLRQKYSLPEVNDLNSLEQYLFTVAEKEKGIQAIAAAGGNGEFRHVIAEQMNKLQPVTEAYDFFYKMDNKSTAPSSSEVFYLFTSDYMKQFADRMVTWASKGVWSKNAINGTMSVNDSFAQGKGAAIAWNGSVFVHGLSLEKAGIGKAGAADLTPDLKFKRSSYSGDSMAITANSENPERAAMALDLIKNNVDLNRLLVGGIKDVHYTLNASGNNAKGPNADKYGWDSWAWGIRRQDAPKPADTDPRQVKIDQNIESRILKTETDGFTFDEAPVKAELAVVNSIRDEYLASFDLGAFGDKTSAKFEEFKGKIEKAGLKKVQDEFTKQLASYLAKSKK